MNIELNAIIFWSIFLYFLTGLIVILGIDIYVKIKTGKHQTHTLKEVPLVLVIYFIWPLYVMFWIAVVSENKRNNSMYNKNKNNKYKGD